MSKHDSDSKELIQRIHPMVNYPGVSDVVSLLVVHINIWKDELAVARGRNIAELQGAIEKVTEIITALKREVPKNNYKNGAYTGD
jgi:mitochondrial fission protein ELM1